MLRGELPLASSTDVTFTRGDGAGCNGDAIDDIQWQRIEFPSAVQEVTLGMAAAAGAAPAALNPAVDTSRTVVFSGGQVSSGQGAGEGSLTGNTRLGASLARHHLTSPTALDLTRGDTSGSARFTSFAVQLDP
jgi:hypothetical protein